MRIKVTVDCIEANKPTANNRIYSEASMLKMVEDANKKIESVTIFFQIIAILILCQILATLFLIINEIRRNN